MKGPGCGASQCKFTRLDPQPSNPKPQTLNPVVTMTSPDLAAGPDGALSRERPSNGFIGKCKHWLVVQEAVPIVVTMIS